MTVKESQEMKPEEQQVIINEIQFDPIEKIKVGAPEIDVNKIVYGQIGHTAAANKKRSMRMRNPKVREKYKAAMHDTLEARKEVQRLRRGT